MTHHTDGEEPDINKRETIVAALKHMEVLAGYSRSYSEGPDGEMVPDRYIEELGHYFDDFQLKQAVDALYDNTFIVNGLSGVITGYSPERILVLLDSGEEIEFTRKVEAAPHGKQTKQKTKDDAQGA